MFQHRHAIEKLGTELQEHNQRRGTGLNMEQLAKSKQARSSFASLTLEMQWLLPKVEMFRAANWWFGVLLLVLRLLQTTFMALVRRFFRLCERRHRVMTICCP